MISPQGPRQAGIILESTWMTVLRTTRNRETPMSGEVWVGREYAPACRCLILDGFADSGGLLGKPIFLTEFLEWSHAHSRKHVYRIILNDWSDWWVHSFKKMIDPCCSMTKSDESGNAAQGTPVVSPAIVPGEVAERGTGYHVLPVPFSQYHFFGHHECSSKTTVPCL